ncbi:MAG: adenylate/guanylate cyclase domain-containing protein [Bacteroidia bacterium]|nr:adenylate/guanylate cyclase domain-containing protein [Bacteroidia bacterium]
MISNRYPAGRLRTAPAPVTEEDRVFMFLDIRSSTRLAESLGSVRYFHLLRDFVQDLSPVITACEGQIYQYAGDQIVVSWPMEGKSCCLNCFFEAADTLDSRRHLYMDRYGVCPEFKAAIHGGTVCRGHIGAGRQEWIYAGDVLNTTSRIEELCNELNTNILISEVVASQLPPEVAYILTSVGVFQLRGRQAAVELFTVARDGQ